VNTDKPMTEIEAVETELTIEALKRKLRGAEDDLQRAKSRIEDLEAYRSFAGTLLRAAIEMPDDETSTYNMRYTMEMARRVLYENFDWLAPSYIPF
jgi:hypothetical protein